MNEQVLREVSESLKISLKQINVVLQLLDEGNTIPFIARYRKEATGGLDEEQIQAIHKEWEYANNLYNRKEDVIRLIDERGMLTPELKDQILKAEKLVDVEDLYRPYKEKKKTKATEAIAKGLEPLAVWMLTFPTTSVEEEAKKYITEEVPTIEEAIEGAKFIIAEQVSDEAEYRKVLRDMLREHGNIVSNVRKNAEDERKTYEIYYDYEEPVSKIKPHRTLAINRAEKEKVITVKVDIERQMMIEYLNAQVIKKENSTATPFIKEAIDDSLKRLIFPSLEREIRNELTEAGEDQAIEIFSMNLHNLLLQPPLQGRVILGVDPAYRTGCKLAVVNKQGKVLAVDTIFPHVFGNERRMEAARKVFQLVTKHKVELIAIGNGTASRETEEFIADVIKATGLKAQYVIVNEAGASVYSASDLAREEFPDLEVEQRSAASIARRLQDPLSELVKIDPKSIGVGQYQHDVTPKKLNDQLNFVVTQAVNSVGVDVNTASKALLVYVSGLTKRTADSIVETRHKIGRYNNREELLKVPYLGEKSYEQAVGF
ncbi:MAG TPA: Tex-like N-terminal domain-containing protein, partial [Acholeplasmataceae bacterium]|nr:Tex-like N-terminal domain-containing protein [Acholeplasmataceae bacterium]